MTQYASRYAVLPQTLEGATEPAELIGTIARVVSAAVFDHVGGRVDPRTLRVTMEYVPAPPTVGDDYDFGMFVTEVRMETPR